MNKSDQQTEKENYRSNRKKNKGKEILRLGSSVGRIALPVFVEKLFLLFMGAVNTILASNLGKEALSAIGMVETINLIIIALFSALAIGGTVIVAQYTGSNRPKKANHAAAQSLLSGLGIAAIITLTIFSLRKPLINILFGNADPIVLANALTYLSITIWSFLPIALITIAFGVLRGSGNTRTPMGISIIMNIINFFLSYLLIYGIQFSFFQTPAYGVAGAAAGLTLSRTCGALLVLIPLLRGSRHIHLNKLTLFRINTDMQKKIFGFGLPASAEQLMFKGGKLIVQIFIVSLGTISMAANAIVNSISTILLVPSIALAIAAPAIVGQQIGAGQSAMAKQQLKFLTLSAVAANAVVSLVVFLFANNILSFYTKDQATLKMALPVLMVNLVVQTLLWPSAFITPSGLRGAGDVRFTMVVSIVSMVFLRILLGYIFAIVLKLGIMGIWLGMYADWIARSILYIRRLLGENWLHTTLFQSVRLSGSGAESSINQ